MKLTETTLAQILEIPHLRAAQWIEVINKTLTQFQITTSLRQAAFLAQIGVESDCLTALEENLNYSSKKLMQVFPNHFPNMVLANLYAHHPQKIANCVYANRLGNRDETSGEGWRYRGRGLIQLTGRSHYQKLSQRFQQDFLSNPDQLMTPQWAAQSAGWFWEICQGNDWADREEIGMISRRINGGTHGLQKRETLYYRAKVLLC